MSIALPDLTELCVFIDALGFVLLQAVLAWALASLIATSIAVLMFSRPLLGSAVGGLAALFGLVPIILYPPMLTYVAQPQLALGGHQLPLISFSLITIASIFPILEPSRDAVGAARARYSYLAAVAGLRRGTKLLHIGWPSIAAQLVRSASLAIPFALLLVVLFEFGTGVGIGPYVLGALNAEGWGPRVAIVIAFAGPCIGLRWLLDRWTSHLSARQGENRQKLDLDRAQDGRERSYKAAFVGGFFAGLVVLLLIWTNTYYGVMATPIQVWEVLTAREDPYRGDLRADLMTASIRTVVFAVGATLVGVLTAGVAAVAAIRIKIVKNVCEFLSVISQSTPIFLLIPLYLLVMPNRWAVFILVGISVTFFVAYDIFRNQLKAQPEHWLALLTIGLPARQPIRVWRSLWHWLRPYLLRQGVVALGLTAPTGILAALVADIFLGMDGLADFGWQRSPSDLKVHMIVMTSAFLLMACSYLAASIAAPRLARDK